MEMNLTLTKIVNNLKVTFDLNVYTQIVFLINLTKRDLYCNIFFQHNHTFLTFHKFHKYLSNANEIYRVYK